MRIQNNENNPYFGTYLGLKMQEKVLFAKQKGMFSPEQLRNLERIESDGLDAVLEIVNKYKIKKVNNKSIILNNECLTVGNGYKNENICELNDIVVPTSDKRLSRFLMYKFIKLFNNDFNLAEKIQAGYNKMFPKS